jgi:hypothetical protein
MAGRAHVIGLLQRELAAARGVHADEYAARIERRIARLSQGSAQDPAREETSRGKPVRPRRQRPSG